MQRLEALRLETMLLGPNRLAGIGLEMARTA